MLGNIAKGFKNARTIGRLKNEGIRLGSQAFDNAASKVAGNAQDAAKFYGTQKAYMDDFMNEYMRGAPTANYNSIGEQIGRGGAVAAGAVDGVKNFAMSNPLEAAFVALPIASMVMPMGGGEPQISPQEMEIMQQQELARRQQLALQQELMQQQMGGVPYGRYS